MRAEAIILVVSLVIWITVSTPSALSQNSNDLPSVLKYAQKAIQSKAGNGSNTNADHGIKYQSYHSEKYSIQFQYPPGWTVKEKASRFEEGYDISIESPNNDVTIGVSHYTDLTDAFGTTDLNSAIFGWVKNMQLRDFSMEYRTIESPSFLDIDGVHTGTVVYAAKARYSDDSVDIGSQTWITFIGTNGYLISFLANADQFDSPENVLDRDQFMNSVHFLDHSSSESPSTESKPV